MNQTTKHNDTNLDHVLKYTGVFGGVQGLSIIISIIRNKLASGLLGAIGFGLMGFYISVGDFINSCSNMGIPVLSVQRISELFEEEDQEGIHYFTKVMRTWCLWAALLALLVCSMAACFYDWHIILLAPMVMALPITGGELSLLKGLRRLKRVAVISLLAAISTFCLTIPFFWAFHLNGIILSLDCSTLAVMGIHLAFTLPIIPWRVSPFSRTVMHDGLPLLRFGIPYVLAGIVGTGVVLAFQTFLREYSSDAVLGYYRVGYTIMVTYAGIVFTALESDFFPRLSSVNHDSARCNLIINQQIRACMLIMTPMLIVLIVIMPFLIHLLYTDEFLPSVEMTIFAVFYMFFRCISVPIEYTALAHGDSKIYMVMEMIYDLFLLTAIISGYMLMGLTGIGIGMSAASLFDIILVGICYSRYYAFHFERSTLLFTAKQGILLVLAMSACLLLPIDYKHLCGLVLFILSLWASYNVLISESGSMQHLRQRLMARFHRSKRED